MYKNEMKIIPSDKIEIARYPGNSEVIFDLFSEADKTRLRETQTDLESFPNHPHFKRERFEWGWDNLLGQNLKHLLENSDKS